MASNDDTQQLREDLATCTRLLVFVGILDFSGHASVRLGDDHFLILPRDMSRAGVTAESLVVVDLEGELVEGEVPPPAEAAIHAGVYRARPDVNAVCHGHPTLSTSFSMSDQPLVPMRHFAYKNPDGLPVHPDATHIYTRQQGDEVAATLGSGGACLLRGHGTVVGAQSIRHLFMDCLDIEENARTLLNAKTAGGAILPLTPNEIESIALSYSKTGHRPGKLWNHYVRLGEMAGVL